MALRKKNANLIRQWVVVCSLASLLAIAGSCSDPCATDIPHDDNSMTPQGACDDLPITEPVIPLDETLFATIAIDASTVVSAIPREIYGTNIEWVFDGYGLYDAEAGALSESIIALAAEMGAPLIRFPGGLFADYYHWRDGVGPAADRATTRQLPGGPKSTHHFGTDEALEFAQRVGGELMITVNVLTGTAREAADWVRYVNGSDIGSRVTYWEIGNEPYGVVFNAFGGSPTMASDVYAEKFLEFAKQMHEADPTIKLGAAVCVGTSAFAKDVCGNFLDDVLSRAGEQIDFVSVHNGYAPTLVDDGHAVRDVYAALLATPGLIAESLAHVAGRVETVMPHRAELIEIAVTEWGPWYQADPDGRYVDHVKTLGSGLFVASTLMAFIESPQTTIANAFKLTDNGYFGWIGRAEEGYAPTATFWAMQLFSNHFGDFLVESAEEGPRYTSPEVQPFGVVADVPYLEAVASLDAKQTTLFLIVINKHFDSPIEAAITIDGAMLDATATRWTLTGPTIDAHTGTLLPTTCGLRWAEQATDTTHSDARFACRANATYEMEPVEDIGRSFVITFPPRSVTSLTFPLVSETERRIPRKR